jgi:hypothetical protein
LLPVVVAVVWVLTVVAVAVQVDLEQAQLHFPQVLIR